MTELLIVLDTAKILFYFCMVVVIGMTALGGMTAIYVAVKSLEE
jgi:hypothetical protein